MPLPSNPAATRPHLLFIALFLGTMAVARAAEAPVAEPEAIGWFFLLVHLAGGLAIFLFGLEQLSEGLKAAAGDSLRTLLAKLTKNRVIGAMTGAVTTALLNSSSVTTVLVVGFITAGMMNLTQAIGVIMGANVGSTVTAQIVAFNVSDYALVAVAIGFFVMFAAPRKNVQNIGGLVMGLGMIFFGMGIMSDAMMPLRDYPPFHETMASLSNPFLGALVGAVFTGLVQSSAATTGLAVVFAADGLVSLDAGIALALGANIGTCGTALLAAIGKPRNAFRVALAHILFNVIGVAAWIWFVPELAQLARSVSPHYPDLAGAARRGAEIPRQIANAHTLFNVINTLAFLPMAGLLGKLIYRLVPERSSERGDLDDPQPVTPKYLDDHALNTPAIALQQVRLELGRMAKQVAKMLPQARAAIRDGDRTMLRKVERRRRKIGILHDRVLAYLSRISPDAQTERQRREILALVSATDLLASSAEAVDMKFLKQAMRAGPALTSISETMDQNLADLFATVVRTLRATATVLRERDPAAAADVVALTAQVEARVAAIGRHQGTKLGFDEAVRLERFRLEMRATDQMELIASYCRKIVEDTQAEAPAVKPPSSPAAPSPPPSK